MSTLSPQLLARSVPGLPDLQAWCSAHPGQARPASVDAWRTQHDDGAGPLSRLVSCCPELVGYTVVFDEATRARLDALPAWERLPAASALVDGMLRAVPAARRAGSLALEYSPRAGWHVHGLLDAGAVPALLAPPGWEVHAAPLPTLDDVRRWAAYCAKRARRQRRPDERKLDLIADRLLRDRRECREAGRPRPKMRRWFGLPTRSAWMSTRRREGVGRVLAARRAPRPPLLRAPCPPLLVPARPPVPVLPPRAGAVSRAPP